MLQGFQAVYDRLGIQGLNERGESFYNPLLPGLVASLMQDHVAEESEGAKVVFVRVSSALPATAAAAAADCFFDRGSWGACLTASPCLAAAAAAAAAPVAPLPILQYSWPLLIVVSILPVLPATAEFTDPSWQPWRTDTTCSQDSCKIFHLHASYTRPQKA